MGRQLGFDRDEKLHQAMKLFWAKGYEATSMQDLVDALEINRFSLYNTFGDKRRLFEEALQRYGKSVMGRLTAPLQQPEAGLPAILDYLDNLEKGLASRAGVYGCFLQNAVVETAPLQDPVRNLVEKAFDALEYRLENALRQACEQGQLQRIRDTRAAARFIVTHVQGIILLHKTMRCPQRLQQSLEFLRSEIRTW